LQYNIGLFSNSKHLRVTTPSKHFRDRFHQTFFAKQKVVGAQRLAKKIAIQFHQQLTLPGF